MPSPLPTVLLRFPISSGEVHVPLRGLPPVRFKSHEIFVWAKIGLAGELAPPEDAPLFPVLLDTGFNHSFLLRDDQLLGYANCHPGSLTYLEKHIKLKGRNWKAPLLDASVWLYPNQASSWKCASEQPPLRLDLDTGIAVVQTGTIQPPWNSGHGADYVCLDRAFPRVPLIGLRALLQNKLCLHIDGPSRMAFLGKRRPWWRLFG